MTLFSKSLLCASALASTVNVATAGKADHHFDLTSWLLDLNVEGSKESIVDIGLKIISSAKTKSETFLKDFPDAKASAHPYFNFLPMWRASMVPDTTNAKSTWSASCFPENTGHVTTEADGSLTVHVVASGEKASPSCYDHYALLTNTGLKTVTLDEAGETSFTWTLPADITAAESWDLNTKGIRMMEFMTSVETSAANLLETASLFVAEFTKHVPKHAAERNVDFMSTYPKMKMEPRDPVSGLPPPAHKVHSGDFFGVIRLDGLDPMLAWGMGSTTGHTTMAQWIDGELYICESTVTDSYWPTNGIQKTPYTTWLKQAQEAGYNVVHAPLNAAYRAKYNSSAAIEFFKENEGLDYGYITMLWGWIDTLYNNYPCVPDDYSSVCLQWELVESLFAVIDRSIPEISNLMWNPAWNRRIGTDGLSTSDIYYHAMTSLDMDSRVIPTIPEQDSWVYNTTRNGEPAVGKSMVCCVFVCNMWKASGMFGDIDFNCAEFTNSDDYELNIFEEEYHQIMGQWTLNFNGYNSKDPFDHMRESCASLAPDYAKSDHC